MKEIGKYATGIVVGVMILAGFYFFEYKPSIKDAREEGYKAGIIECQQDTDTTYLPGKPIYIKDTVKIIKTEPIIEIDEKVLGSVFDTTVVSGKDTIEAEAKTIFDLKTNTADWTFRIEHKDFAPLPDTLRIKVPYYVEKIVAENNWMYNLISFVAGILTTIGIFLL